MELPLFCDMRGLFSAGFGLWLSGSGQAVVILQRVRNLRYPWRVQAKDQRQKRRTGVSDPHGLSRFHGHLFPHGLSFFVFGEHFCGVNGYEGSAAAGQDFTFFIQDFGGVDVGASFYFNFAAFYAQGFVQRDGL